MILRPGAVRLSVFAQRMSSVAGNEMRRLVLDYFYAIDELSAIRHIGDSKCDRWGRSPCFSCPFRHEVGSAAQQTWTWGEHSGKQAMP
jgi:hypothetical protein